MKIKFLLTLGILLGITFQSKEIDHRIPFGESRFFLYLFYCLGNIKRAGGCCRGNVWSNRGLLFSGLSLVRDSANQWIRIGENSSQKDPTSNQR